MDLGPTSYVNGSVLLDLVKDSKLGRDRKTRLSWVWARIQTAYKRLEVDNRLDSLSLSMFTDPDAMGAVFPRLKCKANEGKYFLVALLEVLQDPLLKDQSDYGTCRLPLFIIEFLLFYLNICPFYNSIFVVFPECFTLTAPDCTSFF